MKNRILELADCRTACDPSHFVGPSLLHGRGWGPRKAIGFLGYPRVAMGDKNDAGYFFIIPMLKRGKMLNLWVKQATVDKSILVA